MDADYGSIHVKTTDEAAVHDALRRIASETIEFLVAKPSDGWIAVYPSGHGQDERISKKVSRRLEYPVLHVAVHDDDVLYYVLYTEGKIADRYCSCPDYFEEVSAAMKQRMRGDPRVLAEAVGHPEKAEKVAALFKRMQVEMLCKSDCLDRFAEALGLPNPWTAFEYLVEEGATEELERDREFTRVAKPKRKQRAARSEPEPSLKSFRGAIHIRDAKESSVFEVVREIADGRRRFLVAPPADGWISVYPCDAAQDESVAATFAQRLGVPVLHLAYRNDAFCYLYYRNGEVADRYASRPDCFPEHPDTATAPELHAQRLASLLPQADHVGALAELLGQIGRESQFDSECVGQFGELLGLKSARTTFDDLMDDLEDRFPGCEDMAYVRGAPLEGPESDRMLQRRWVRHEERRCGPLFAIEDAIIEGLHEEVWRILDTGFDINTKVKKKGWTPLMMAAYSCNVKIVEGLLKRGADPNVRDVEGRTPIRVALMAPGRERRMLRLLRMLIDAGVDPSVPDNDGKTPLERAGEFFREPVLSLLRGE